MAFGSLLLGVLLIGLGAYSSALNGHFAREKERRRVAQLTGLPQQPPTAEQEARDRNKDMATGATFGGMLWLVG